MVFPVDLPTFAPNLVRAMRMIVQRIFMIQDYRLRKWGKLRGSK